MDVTKYNKIETGPCMAPKHWAKQRERYITCYIENNRNLIINAEFSDGKSMWVSADTLATDIETNTAIFTLIIETMDEAPSEWYATDFKNVKLALRIGADRLDRAAKLTAVLLEKRFMDFAEQWNDYCQDTAGILAKQLAQLFDNSQAYDETIMARLELLSQKLYSFSTEGNTWHYHYGDISPTIAEIRKLAYLKINPDPKVREKYRAMLEYSESLYNRYQSMAR